MFCHTKSQTVVKELSWGNLEVVCWKRSRLRPLTDPVFIKCSNVSYSHAPHDDVSVND